MFFLSFARIKTSKLTKTYPFASWRQQCVHRGDSENARGQLRPSGMGVWRWRPAGWTISGSLGLPCLPQLWRGAWEYIVVHGCAWWRFNAYTLAIPSQFNDFGWHVNPKSFAQLNFIVEATAGGDGFGGWNHFSILELFGRWALWTILK